MKRKIMTPWGWVALLALLGVILLIIGILTVVRSEAATCDRQNLTSRVNCLINLFEQFDSRLQKLEEGGVTPQPPQPPPIPPLSGAMVAPLSSWNLVEPVNPINVLIESPTATSVELTLPGEPTRKLTERNARQQFEYPWTDADQMDAGQHTVTAVLTDQHGQSLTLTTVLTVRPKPVMPPPVILPPVTGKLPPIPPPQPGIDYPVKEALTIPDIVMPSARKVHDANQNLQSLFDNAICGVNVIPSGVVFRPPIEQTSAIVRNRGCTASNPMVFIPSNLDGFPNEGERLDPAKYRNFYKWRPPLNTTRGIVSFEPGTGYVTFLGMDLSGNSTGLTVMDQDYMDIGVNQSGGYPTSVEQMPHHIIIDRSYIHGQPYPAQSKRGISLNGVNLTVMNSYFEEIHGGGDGGTCIGAWAGAGIFRISNNYLSCVGIPILIGGSSTWIVDLVPSDIFITRNTVEKPLPLFGKPSVISKNTFELKNARRVLAYANHFKNGWTTGGGQRGYCALFSARNDQGNMTWATVEHIHFQLNWCDNMAAGVGVSATGWCPEVVSPNHCPTRVANRIYFGQLLITYMDAGRLGFAPHISNILQPGGVDIRMQHITEYCPSGNCGTLWAEEKPIGKYVFNDNITHIGTTGFNGSNCGRGRLLPERCPGSSDSSIKGNLIVGGQKDPLQIGVRMENGVEIPIYHWDPPNNEYPADWPFKPGTYEVADQYKGKATDGTDPGANVRAVLEAVAGL